MTGTTLKLWRRLVQTVVLVGCFAVPVLNELEIHLVKGNFLSWNVFGIPFSDPLAALQVALVSVSLPWRMVVGAGLVLTLAFFLGTVFCSWVCPFGLLSELAAGFRRSRRVPAVGTEHEKGLFSRLAVTVVGLIGVVLFSPTPLLNQLSMPGWISKFPQQYVLQGYISPVLWLVFGILIAEGVLGKRLWCRYVCPQSVPLILVKWANPGRLRIQARAGKCTCTGRQCHRSCSLDLEPLDHAPARDLACTNCGDCRTACEKTGSGLIEYEFGRSALKG